MRPLSGTYSFTLNTGDMYDPELPLVKAKASGGTLVLWKKMHDPFISVWPVSSSAFLPILFQPTDSVLSIHVAIYLPTAGQDAQFVEELANLTTTLEEISENHPESPVYLRGDFNVSHKNSKRMSLLDHFCKQFSLLEVPILHPTYHHFVGRSESFLDRILFTSSLSQPEVLKTIHCKLAEPFINSHHDMLITTWSVPSMKTPATSTDNIVAPKVENNRHKVIWSDSGIEAYQELVIPHLSRLQELWLHSSSRTSSSLLLEATNNVLSSSALKTNKAIPLNGSSKPKAKNFTPRPIRLSQNKLLKEYKIIQKALTSGDIEKANKLKEDYNRARTMHRKLERAYKAEQSHKRDQNLFSICSNDPSPIFRNIKSSKRSTAGKINKLKVGKKVYTGEAVQDGFYDSISQLKSRDSESLRGDSKFTELSSDYLNILEVCKHGSPIPPISERDSFKLMQKMKPDVNDVYGVTVNHFNYAGQAGWKHFYLLLNSLISDVNNTDIEEVNTVYACILFKGHKKDKSSDRSYRTISTCPVLAKALDLYVRDLGIVSWNENQASTQFQGEGSSHELAAVMLTEAIQHSLFTLKQPAFILYLDAQSAFDVVLRELLVRNLFNCNTSGHSLLYINNRLGNRRTFIDWSGNLMGPIEDEQGLEQGGVNSSDFYKIFGKEQLTSAQDSKLGVEIGNLTISGIGQADDTGLVSNDILKLLLLLKLSEEFCKKHHVKLCADKTKLQVYGTKKMKLAVEYAKQTNPISIDGEKINFVETAEHVGILRSSSGNSVTILTRITAHKNALRAVLFSGMARGHRGNPAASLHVDQVYGVPVLLSGLGPLVFSKPDLSLVNQHHKEIISNLQRLLPSTPRSVVYFLAGSLPGEALLHLRQLTIFGMISRLQNSTSHELARNLLSSDVPPTKSWIFQVQEHCRQYDLPDPLQQLHSPIPKETFKRLVKKNVLSYWEHLLRVEAADPRYSSLAFFHPEFMSLTSPHPVWTTCGSSPSKIAMASIQARMISGRYRSESLCKHWSKNKDGFCQLSPSCANTVEDIPHILTSCSGLSTIRDKLIKFTLNYASTVPAIQNLILSLCIPSNPRLVQFLLDCSCLPEVVRATQMYGQEVLGHLFTITRTWVYTLHKSRMKILGRWNFI